METERVEMQWQAVMGAAVALKKKGIDTSDAVKTLRDAKVLLNHCIYDEHAHGEELFEAELEIEGIQRDLASILEKEGMEGDVSFEAVPPGGKTRAQTSPPPSKMPKNKTWVRIRVTEGMNVNDFSKIEGVEVLEQDSGTVTLIGDKASIQKALN